MQAKTLLNATQEHCNLAVCRRAAKFIWLLTALVAVLDIVFSITSGIKFNKNVLLFLAGISLFLGSIYLFYKHKRQDAGICSVIEILLQAVLFSNLAAAFSYLSASTSLPLYDDLFSKADIFIGFDYLGYAQFIHSIPWLSWLLTMAYISIGAQFVIMMMWLFVVKNTLRLQEVMLASALGAIVSIIISASLPSVSAYLHYAYSGVQFDYVALGSQISDLFLLRSGGMSELPIMYQGIITFPSFHSTLGVMFIYAFWNFFWLRLLVFPLNLLLFLSTTVEGGHYLIDTFAGILIGIITLLVARRVTALPS